MEKKITKRKNFVAIVEALEAVNLNALADVMKHEIELLDRKAAKTKDTAAKKKAEGDELTEAVKIVLTDEPATIADITEKVQFDGEVSVARVQYRLNQLVKMQYATKTQITVEGDSKRKLVAYSVAPIESEN